MQLSAKDFSQTNYSSSRLSILEDRDHWRVVQSVIIQLFHQRVYEEWLRAAALAGDLPSPAFNDYWTKPERYNNPRWQARSYNWIDPAKELKGVEMARRLLLQSHSAQISEHSGDQFEQVVAQIAMENELKESLGLMPGMQVDDRTDETLTFSFSSEAPVERFFGREILVHEKGAMDLSRLNDGAPWLWNHERGVVLGVVEKAWLGDDRRLYSTVRWSPNTTERGTEEYRRRNDIEAGITKNVSFAYSIDDIDERDGDFYVTKWKALEVSSVSVPADQSVGLGRAMDEPSAVDTANPDPELLNPMQGVAETIGESLV
jgi:phage head maturation protease